VTPGERMQLVRELDAIQLQVPTVQVTYDRARDELAAAQARVDEIERMLAADLVVRSASADLGE